MARPLLDISCIERDGCKYPVAVRLLMDDNTVQTYTLECKVNPVVQKASDILTESIQNSIGYLFKPKKRRNRTHRGSECGR